MPPTRAIPNRAFQSLASPSPNKYQGVRRPRTISGMEREEFRKATVQMISATTAKPNLHTLHPSSATNANNYLRMQSVPMR